MKLPLFLFPLSLAVLAAPAAPKTDKPAKGEEKNVTAENPPADSIEYEEVWLPVGTVFNYPEGSRPAEVFPTGAKFMPGAKTPLRIRTRKDGRKIAVRVDGLPLHSKYFVKARRGAWNFEINKGDFVERMIRRPKPVQPMIVEPVEKVEVEEKKELETDTTPAEIDTIKDQGTIAAQVTETERVSEDFSRPFHDRKFGAGIVYHSNYVEHYAQYFTLPTAAWLLKADYYTPAIGRLSFQYLAAGTGENVPSGSTYKNPNFWRVGYNTRYFGMHYKSQSTPNPAGLLVRDNTTSEAGARLHYAFSVADRGLLDIGSNVLMFWYKNPATSTAATTVTESTLLIHFTADFRYQLWRTRGFFEVYGHAGTAYSLGDGTATGYDSAGNWTASAAGQRKFQFTGFRVGGDAFLQLIDAFRVIASLDWYPVMSKDYARYTSLARETATTMVVFTISGEYRI